MNDIFISIIIIYVIHTKKQVVHQLKYSIHKNKVNIKAAVNSGYTFYLLNYIKLN